MNQQARTAAQSVVKLAQDANSDYQLFYLRLALAVDYLCICRHDHQEELLNFCIGQAIDFACRDFLLPPPEQLLELTNSGFSTVHLSVQCALDTLDKSPFKLYLCQFKSLIPEYSSARIFKDAILHHPNLLRLYHKAFSEYITDDIQNPLVRSRKRVVSQGISSTRSRRTYYFSPVLQISIGHYQHVTNLLAYFNGLDLPLPSLIVFASSASSLGVTIFEHFREIFPHINILILSADDILTFPLVESSIIFDSDLYALSVPSSIENGITGSLTPSFLPNKSVSIHLRTGLFKLDMNNPHASLRSVQPKSYQHAISSLSRNGYSSTLIAAESAPEVLDDCQYHVVSDLNSQYKQWKIIANANLFIGTTSGISHICNHGHNPLFIITNSTSLGMSDFQPFYHLISCKRFLPCMATKALQKYSNDLILSLVALPWELDHGLSRFAEIRDLSPLDISSGISELIGFYNGSSKPHSLYDLCDLLQAFGFKASFPNRLLSQTTYIDMIHLFSSLGRV